MLGIIKKYINFVKHPKTVKRAFLAWISLFILFFLFIFILAGYFAILRAIFGQGIMLYYSNLPITSGLGVLFFLTIFLPPIYYLYRYYIVFEKPQINIRLKEWRIEQEKEEKLKEQKKLMEQEEKRRQEKAEEDRKKQIIRRAIENNYSAVCIDCGHAWHKRSLSVYVCPKCKSNNVKTLE